MAQLRIFGLVGDSIVDGPGLRFGVFVQGCSHGCPGCHNPESQPAEGGTVWDVADLADEIERNKLAHGVTISGGEPFEQAHACADLAELLRQRGHEIWVYSGYLYEELMARTGEEGDDTRRLLAAADVLVDGPFVEALKSYDLHWCGSSNQRVIDLRRTRESGHVVLYRHEVSFPEKPVAW